MSYTYKATFSIGYCDTVEVDLKDLYDTEELDNMTEEELRDKAEEMAWYIIRTECECGYEPDLIEMKKEVE